MTREEERCGFCGSYAVIGGKCATCGRGINRAPSAKRPRRGRAATTRQAGRMSQEEFRAQQRERVLAALRRHGNLTRDGIAVATGIPPQTITWRVDELLKSGHVVELSATEKTSSGGQGRLLQLSSIPVPPDPQRGLPI